MTLQILPAPVQKGLGKSRKGEKERKSNGKRGESTRALITVTVPGSSGPIRFVVREEEPVSAVMGTALKAYARQGRRPIIGCELNDFSLYRAFDGSQRLSPLESIGSFGSRNFLLCKKQSLGSEESSPIPGKKMGKKGAFPWRNWLNKSFIRRSVGAKIMAAGAA